MPVTVTNKVFGFITAESASLTSPVTLYTVPAGANFLLKTVKAVDRGSSGGEIVLSVGDYVIEALTVGADDSIDCSPFTPYALEAGSVIKWQSQGGADIHVTLTGILQTVS